MASTPEFIRFLQEELAIAAEAIAIAQRVSRQSVGPLHIVLWQLGLASLHQLERAFEWLEYHSGL